MKNLSILNGRRPFILIAVACIGLLGYAYYAEHVLGLEPCPLCMLQRLGFMGMLLGALVATAHSPGRFGRAVYAGLIGLSGGWGVTTAYRHVWLQSLPPDEVPDCGPGFAFMQDYGFTWAEIIVEAFTGSGQCAEIDWSFMGLSMPAWTLIWYVGLIILTLAAVIWGKPSGEIDRQLSSMDR